MRLGAKLQLLPNLYTVRKCPNRQAKLDCHPVVQISKLEMCNRNFFRRLMSVSGMLIENLLVYMNRLMNYLDSLGYHMWNYKYRWIGLFYGVRANIKERPKSSRPQAYVAHMWHIICMWHVTRSPWLVANMARTSNSFSVPFWKSQAKSNLFLSFSILRRNGQLVKFK